MGRKKSQRTPISSNWMDTYGDMVTLLLCFFVILFAMSTMDTSKWEIIVKSLNPRADKVSQIAKEPSESEGEDPVDSTQEGLMTENVTFEQIYFDLRNYVEQNSLSQDIEVLKGDDFTFLVFRNSVFFDGDSYILREEGKVILDYLIGALAVVSDQVGSISVMGHTNQADPNNPNIISEDRFLSSNRATQVLVYMEEKKVIEPYKLRSIGYGQHHPLSDFITKEGRAENRRVEISLLRGGAKELSLSEMYEQLDDSEE